MWCQVRNGDGRSCEVQARETGIEVEPIWAGYRNDTPQVMAALDIFALPSILPEPFGMVVVEAMATVRPVVATVRGGAGNGGRWRNRLPGLARRSC